ncbi:hypothetical protein BBJ28_00024006, partial [Nothophytophthora sp. Chile5]
MEHAGLVPNANPNEDLKITPGQNQAFLDISTPSPNSRRFGKRTDGISTQRAPAPHPPHSSTMINVGQHGVPPLKKPAQTNFMDSSQFMNMNSTTAQIIGRGPPQMSANCKKSGRGAHRRRPNVDAMVRSSMVRQSLARASNLSSLAGSTYGPQPGTDVMSVPVLGDCNFEQKYTVAMSQDEQGNQEFTPMEKLQALRDVMSSITDKGGYIERETFSQAFEVSGDEYDGYTTEKGTIDGNAILVDAVMDLEVGAEEKLRFIFETLDPENSGYVIEDQIVQLLESNFSQAKIDVVGTDFKTMAKLMFRKAQVKDGTMTYPEFKMVFGPYISDSYGLRKSEPMYTAPIRPRSKFGRWYSTNKLRIWWLLFYFALNMVAFWVKWFSY